VFWATIVHLIDPLRVIGQSRTAPVATKNMDSREKGLLPRLGP
jgi:hypothetical protein